jgi:hypothetical protein
MEKLIFYFNNPTPAKDLFLAIIVGAAIAVICTLIFETAQ